MPCRRDKGSAFSSFKTFRLDIYFSLKYSVRHPPAPSRQQITEFPYIFVRHTSPFLYPFMRRWILRYLILPRLCRQYLGSLFSMDDVRLMVANASLWYKLALMFVLFMKLLYLWQTSHPPNYCYYLQQWQMISRCNASVWVIITYFV